MATQAKLIEGVKEVIQDSTFTSTRILDYINQGQRVVAGGVFITYPDRTQVISSPLPDLMVSDDLTTSITLPYIDMPSDYGRNLFFLSSETNDIEIELYESFTELLRIYPNLDDTNRVVAAAVRGGRLYYQGYPTTAETLAAHYHRTPYDMATLTGGADISFATNTITDAGNGLGVFYAGQTLDVTGTSNNNDTLTVSSVAATGATLVVDEDLTTEANTTATIKSRPDGIPEHLHESVLENFAAWRIFERKTKNDQPMELEAKRYHGLFLGGMLNMEAAIEVISGSVRFVNDDRY
jgi:hypothetical protein